MKKNFDFPIINCVQISTIVTSSDTRPPIMDGDVVSNPFPDNVIN